jgi:RND family efflux transporter MFP subunit
MSISLNKVLGAAALLSLAACAAHEQSPSPSRVAAATEAVQLSAVPEMRVTTGTVRSSTVSPLSAKVMGNVTRVLVSEGDSVRRGQILLEIDARDIQARVAQANAGSRGVDEAILSANAAVAGASANAEFASATLRRFTALRERGSVSPHEFEEVSAKASGAGAELERAKRMRDQLIAQRDQARGGVAEAETFLSYATVRSPIDGIVTARFIDPGAQAAPGMPLLTVEDAASRRVETTVDESLAASLRPGQGVVIDDVPTRIAHVASVDPNTRSALVKIELPANSPLRSGSFVHVRFTTGSRNALTIPATAVATRGQLTMVYVVDGAGAARMRMVTLGETFGDRTEVLTGLEASERIVTTPQTVREGVLLSGARVSSPAPGARS